MVITAKYASNCATCGRRIRMGDKILWSPGVPGATHIECPEKPEISLPKDINIEGVRIIEMLDVAANHLKYPKIQISYQGLGKLIKLKLYRAGPKSKYHGHAMIVNPDLPHMNNWYGRVNREGVFWRSRQLLGEPKLAESITTFLKNFAEDPEQKAREYGILTGNCCFCHSPLSNPRSTEIGYGPICAKHYNLPWGNINQKQTTVQEQHSLFER